MSSTRETLYGDRMNQLDFRVGKLFRSGRYRTSVSLDILQFAKYASGPDENSSLHLVATAADDVAGAVLQDQRAVRLLTAAGQAEQDGQERLEGSGRAGEILPSLSCPSRPSCLLFLTR